MGSLSKHSREGHNVPEDRRTEAALSSTQIGKSIFEDLSAITR